MHGRCALGWLAVRWHTPLYWEGIREFWFILRMYIHISSRLVRIAASSPPIPVTPRKWIMNISAFPMGSFENPLYFGEDGCCVVGDSRGEGQPSFVFPRNCIHNRAGACACRIHRSSKLETHAPTFSSVATVPMMVVVIQLLPIQMNGLSKVWYVTVLLERWSKQKHKSFVFLPSKLFQQRSSA